MEEIKKHTKIFPYEEIHQDIENRAGELAERYCKHDDPDLEREGFDAYNIGFKGGANFVLKKWQEAERWRKVEEELPTPKDDLVIVRVRNKNKEDGILLHDICYIDECTNTWGKREHTWEDIIEWRPIN